MSLQRYFIAILFSIFINVNYSFSASLSSYANNVRKFTVSIFVRIFKFLATILTLIFRPFYYIGYVIFSIIKNIFIFTLLKLKITPPKVVKSETKIDAETTTNNEFSRLLNTYQYIGDTFGKSNADVFFRHFATLLISSVPFTKKECLKYNLVRITPLNEYLKTGYNQKLMVYLANPALDQTKPNKALEYKVDESEYHSIFVDFVAVEWSATYDLKTGLLKHIKIGQINDYISVKTSS